jgi:alginate O-acetyltransferase complex protein AlgI
MSFQAPLFLFVFLPLTAVTVLMLGGKWRGGTLLACSAVFYFWAEPRFFGIVLVLAIADHLCCQQIFQSRDPQRARIYTVLGVILNLAALLYFKYVNFFVAAINTILDRVGLPSISFPAVALPVGISFIVFEKITYLVDVYRGCGQPAPSLFSYLLYILFFPKLLAGPIVKYHEIEKQLNYCKISSADFFQGLERFLLGLIKKVLVADTLGEVVDEAFAIPPQYLGFVSAWLGVICFTLQIYFDFSAYSDMAIGLGRMFGFSLRENFHAPYIATSFTDFWRRWHISLSSWVKEYLYIPLGGNRQGQLRTYINLWLCFLLSGLWHGASWTFVLWGAYHGLFLTLDKLFWLNASKRVLPIINIFLTLFFVAIGWVLFRAASLLQFAGFIEAMFTPSKGGAFIFITANVWMAIAVGCFLSFIPAVKQFDAVVKLWRSWKASRCLENLALSSLAFIALGKAVTVTFQPFLYFRF